MDTKDFKNLLKESITNPKRFMQEVEDDTSPEAMYRAGKIQKQRAAKKKKSDGSDRKSFASSWQKASPETFNDYMKILKSVYGQYSTWVKGRQYMSKDKWIDEFVDLFNLEKLGYNRNNNEQLMMFIDKNLGGVRGDPSFRSFQNKVIDWRRHRLRDEGDYYKIIDTEGDIFLREATKQDIEYFLTYFGKLILDTFERERQEKSKEKGYESAEEETEMSEKRLGEIIKKIDQAKKEIEDASTKLTSDNIMTLVRYAVFGTFLDKPDSIRTIHGTFGNYIKTTLENFLNKEGNNIQQFMAGLVDNLSKSPLYGGNTPDIVRKMYQGKKLDSLIAIDQLIDEKPRGFQGPQNTKTINDIISIYNQKEDALNEGIHGTEIKEYLNSFIPFAKKRLGYDKDPKINFVSDPENGEMPLGKTAYYEPANMSVTVFTDNRHPKDIMRSLSHELVHHAQNCDGQFDLNHGVGEGYAQNDEHLRKMEEDAYLRGNMCFRDWEDSYKQNNPMLERKERLYYKLMRRIK